MLIHQPENQQINFLDSRYYSKTDGVYYPSVTTVLNVYPKGKQFEQWLKDVGLNADDIVRRAANQGTNVHNAIDKYLKGEEVKWATETGHANYILEEWLMFLKFVEFWSTWNPKMIANEFNLISDTYKLGGTIDIMCEINGERWLLDAKSSNSLHTTHELQLAAYAMMWNEVNPQFRVDRTGIIWLKALTRGADKLKKSIQGKGWQIKEYDRHYTEAWKLFQHTRAIWDEENPNYKPANMIYPDRIKLETIAA